MQSTTKIKLEMKTQRRDSVQNIYGEELKNLLNKKIIGQKHVVELIVPYINNFHYNLHSVFRPAGVFFLAGPTGTGKTHFIESLASIIHDNPSRHLRINCAEFQKEHEVAKLIGAPPGYLGHRETSALLSRQKIDSCTSDISNLSIVLFDEIEKASSSLLDILLGVLDRGIITLGDCSDVKFFNSMIFMTSNIGATEIQNVIRGNYLGFKGIKKEDITKEKIKNSVRCAAERYFRPEFLNRIDEFIVYNSLTKNDVNEILELQIIEYNNFLNDVIRLPIQLSVTQEAKAYIIDQSYSEEYGARNLKRYLQKEVFFKLNEKLIEQNILRSKTYRVELPVLLKINIELNKNKFTFKISQEM